MMRRLVLPLLAAALLGVTAVWFFGIGTPVMMTMPRPFSAERWRTAEDGSYVRCAMVADLRYRIGLVGRTGADVVELLGPPDLASGGLPASYVLCPSFMDVYILEIRWENGRVAATEVRDT
jgi:hypothetical protein